MCKYQRFSVQKWPKHRYLQRFVPSTFSWNCKNRVNTIIFCDQHAKNAVIYSVFCLAFKNTGICSVLCISGWKRIGIYSIFRVFAWLPQKTLKRKNAVIYSILWLSKSWKLSEKCVKTALFSDFRYPPNGGGGRMLLETLISDPDSGQKALPHPPEGFLVFFGPRRRRVGGLGRASP